MGMFDLPRDLLEEILSRVPARFRRGLRFICKRWNALLKDPEFVKKQNSVLIFSNFKVYSLSVNLNEIHNPSIKFTSILRRNLNESEQVALTRVFHCNGLLLCSMEEACKKKLVVVNPCTGQIRWVEPTSVYNMHYRYVLGYANNNNKSYESYKILRYSYCIQLEIFELKSNSWRVLANIPSIDYQYTFGRCVSLKGNAYWISCLSFKFDILSFDFTRERFKRLCLPFQKLHLNTIALSDVREEKLLLLHGRLDTQQMDIWVSNKIGDDHETVFSWSNSYTLDLPSQFDHIFLSFLSFLIDEKKKVVVCCGRSGENEKYLIYIVSKHGCRKLDYDTDQSNYCWPFFFSYVPSLVSLNLNTPM